MIEEHSETGSCRARYLLDRFTPHGRQMLAWLSDDVLQLAYEAIPAGPLIAPPDVQVKTPRP